MRTLVLAAATLALFATAPVRAQLSIDITNPSDWQISNGVISLDWNSTTAHVFSVHLAGHPDELVDTTTTQNGQPDGLYMDNSGVGSGTTSAS
jgi:hypothetical protein